MDDGAKDQATLHPKRIFLPPQHCHVGISPSTHMAVLEKETVIHQPALHTFFFGQLDIPTFDPATAAWSPSPTTRHCTTLYNSTLYTAVAPLGTLVSCPSFHLERSSIICT
eukprot:TRINITY_DN67329_c9_g1_i1.p1 TRINITY_DN67329_c9_g1~~TRINITY_DN67329_c9_g1_i1.p1  ORF type:complete len:111 (-),score=7.59 TRINITY_DN67329_c9_g1_i1:226-558(-)